MRALVVYESMFGNTAEVARAIAEGLGDRFDVTLAEVHDMPTMDGVELLVVGAPTHAFGLSRPATRADAVRQGAPAQGQEGGLREFLDTAPKLPGLAAAAFDTKVRVRFMSGSAARKALRRLRELGCRPVVPAENFLVGGTTGPLLEGELERARRWAGDVASAA
jgi:flavodoxin